MVIIGFSFFSEVPEDVDELWSDEVELLELSSLPPLLESVELLDDDEVVLVTEMASVYLEVLPWESVSVIVTEYDSPDWAAFGVIVNFPFA